MAILRAQRPPYRPDVPCYTQQIPDLNGAAVGAGESSRTTPPTTIGNATQLVDTTLGPLQPILNSLVTDLTGLASQHGLRPVTFFGSLALRGTMIMLAVAPNNIASAYGDQPLINATVNEAALQMDSAPDGSPPTKSLWQTDCVAILVKLPIAWAVRSSSGAAWLTATNW